MEYGRLLGRAWDIIWEQKFLILLGVLAALGGGGGGGSTATGSGVSCDLPAAEELRIPEIRVPGVVPTGVGAVAMLVVVGILVIATVLFAVSTIAKGGLIAGVNTIEEGGSPASDKRGERAGATADGSWGSGYYLSFRCYYWSASLAQRPWHCTSGQLRVWPREPTWVFWPLLQLWCAS